MAKKSGTRPLTAGGYTLSKKGQKAGACGIRRKVRSESFAVIARARAARKAEYRQGAKK